MPKPDDKLLRRAVRVARDLSVRSGDHLLARQGGVRKIAYKGGTGNLVTEMDRASERRIVRGLRRAFPDHDIVAEEEERRETGSPFRWHIDPLDGTTNYAHGLPVFAVSIGLEVEGRVDAGAVYAPALGELYHARRGAGAFRNRKRLGVTRTRKLERSLLATGFPYRRAAKKKNLEFFGRFLFDTRAVRRLGSASLDLSWVAAGRFDGFWEFALGSWDIAAGILFVEEAGGRVTDFAGGPVSLERGEILATNGPLHASMLRRLKGRSR